MGTRNSDFKDGRKACVQWGNSGRFLFLFGVCFLVLWVETEKQEIFFLKKSKAENLIFQYTYLEWSKPFIETQLLLLSKSVFSSLCYPSGFLD